MAVGCSFVPETRQRDRLHNPFPQLKKVAVLPFFNQSSEPTLDTGLVTQQYYAALQAIPGFEVMPVGVSRAHYVQYSMQYGEPQTGEELQRFAQQIGVEAIVVGSVTDFDAYYPPKLAMTVNWYAANDGFHPIPAGYGLPWGTEHEKEIPKRIVNEAEFELARSQLATQTPLPSDKAGPAGSPSANEQGMIPAGFTMQAGDSAPMPPSVMEELPLPLPDGSNGSRPMDPYIGDPSAGGGQFHEGSIPGDAYQEPGYHDPAYLNGEYQNGEYQDGAWSSEMPGAMLPPDWPDATDLIPDPPLPHRPETIVSHEPILSHTRIYHGDDPYFTSRLSDHIETGDDARPGGWQGYLRRSDDFIRFCCHLHITEMLESRGGADQSDLILRWPLSRY